MKFSNFAERTQVEDWLTPLRERDLVGEVDLYLFEDRGHYWTVHRDGELVAELRTSPTRETWVIGRFVNGEWVQDHGANGQEKLIEVLCDVISIHKTSINIRAIERRILKNLGRS